MTSIQPGRWSDLLRQMLLRRIKLDRKAGRVVIKGERFYLNRTTGYFWTECGSTDLLWDVRFSEIPRELVVYSRFAPRVPESSLVHLAFPTFPPAGQSTPIIAQKSFHLRASLTMYLVR